jgi:hypothetical protein
MESTRTGMEALMCQKMKTYPLHVSRRQTSHSPAYAAHAIMGEVTLYQLRKFFYLSQDFDQTVQIDGIAAAAVAVITAAVIAATESSITATSTEVIINGVL